MGYCCICGNTTDSNSGSLLINGRTAPICDECAEVLDQAETLEMKDPRRAECLDILHEKMRLNGSGPAVIETVNKIIASQESMDFQKFIENEKEETRRQKQEEETMAATVVNPIERYGGFLAVFAIIFLVVGIILCIVMGGTLMNNSDTAPTGWAVLIGGSLLCILSYAMIMLLLSVASAIGKINDKIDDINGKLDKIVTYLSAENRKQKK